MAKQNADKNPTVNIMNGVITGVTPDPIRMGKGPNQQIEWSIASPDLNANYTFPDNGIVITTPDPSQQFTKLGPNGNRTKFKFHDKNGDINRYKYTVNIMAGTTPLTPLDPIISNGD